MLAGMCSSGLAVRALALGALATIIAPHLALAESGVAIEDSIKVGTAVTPSPSGVSKRSNEKINMVVATLTDILQSVVNEEAEETAIFTKYSHWCQTEQDYNGMDVSDGKEASENFKVVSEEQMSSIDNLKLFLAKTEKEIEETKNSMAKADNLYNEEKEQYTDDMVINTQSLKQIDAAIQHVRKVNQQGGFVQNVVTQKSRMNSPGESNYVLGVMEGLKDKLEKTRASMKVADEENDKMHNSFMKTRGESLNFLTVSVTEKKNLLAETNAKQSGLERTIGKLTEEVATLAESGSRTGETCEKAEKNWKVRQEDRTKEKAALREAIRYLTASALEQVSLMSTHLMSIGASLGIDKHISDEDAEVLPLSFLQAADTSPNSDAAFDEVAHRVFRGMAEEPEEVHEHLVEVNLDGVKGIVSKLISTHQDNQQEETEKRTFCDNEITSKEAERTETSNALAAVKADIDKKASEADMLIDEVKSLYASQDKLRKGLEEAGSLRKQQAAVFEAGSKDRALAIKVLKQAVGVLQKFYKLDQANLLQQAPAFSPSPRKATASFGAVSMVQDIADDIAKEQKDAAIQEKQAADAYAALQQDSNDARDSKQQDITDRVKFEAKLNVQINTLEETQIVKVDDLKAITDQLSSLHKECDELLHRYDQKKEDRTFEVAQLRDVMDILAGSSGTGIRTGFLQPLQGSLQA